MTTIANNEFWIEFFQLFESLPELWKVKSDVYKDKKIKKKSWETLLEIFKEVQPNETVDLLKKKIGNIRTCFRKELKKVEKSWKSGAEGEEYIPSLWYFDNLLFLKDQETQINGVSSMDSDNDDLENSVVSYIC